MITKFINTVEWLRRIVRSLVRFAYVYAKTVTNEENVTFRAWLAPLLVACGEFFILPVATAFNSSWWVVLRKSHLLPFPTAYRHNYIYYNK